VKNAPKAPKRKSGTKKITEPSRPKLFVSSTVYRNEEMLDQIYATLTGIGYEVWMSRAGTVPVDSDLTAFQSCLVAVERCDLFLGIISGYYGSGVDGADDSITHQELSKAITLQKRRWFLVHQDVITIRNFVKAILRFEQREKTEICSKLELRQHDPISDMRVLKMYEEATRSNVVLNQRFGNWVQPYINSHDVLKFVGSQLGQPSRYSHSV
jgi:hypothetical protein